MSQQHVLQYLVQQRAQSMIPSCIQLQSTDSHYCCIKEQAAGQNAREALAAAPCEDSVIKASISSDCLTLATVAQGAGQTSPETGSTVPCEESIINTVISFNPLILITLVQEQGAGRKAPEAGPAVPCEAAGSSRHDLRRGCRPG